MRGIITIVQSSPEALANCSTPDFKGDLNNCLELTGGFDELFDSRQG